MTKPDVTLQPSKGIVTQAAAQIYSAYITAGHVNEDTKADELMTRSIREAIRIARTVDASAYSDGELPDGGEQQQLPEVPTGARLPQLDTEE